MADMVSTVLRAFNLPTIIIARTNVLNSGILNFTGITKPVGEDAFLSSRCSEFSRCAVSASTCVRESTCYAGVEQSHGFVDLEVQIFEFMQRSSNPRRFPTKEDLVAENRLDLVEAIAAEGGWLALGWGCDQNNGINERPSGNRLDCRGGSAPVDIAASSGTTTGIERGDDKIEAIKIHSKKCPSSSSLMGSSIKESIGKESSLDAGWKITSRTTPFTAVSDQFNDSESTQHSDTRRSLNESEQWRTWSSQRAGYSGSSFEVADVVPLDGGNGTAMGHSFSHAAAGVRHKCHLSESTNDVKNSKKGGAFDYGDGFQNQMYSCLQQLKQELSSVLNLLRSKHDVAIGEDENNTEELQKLSDSWKVHQAEIRKAHTNLHSTRAKLAAMEGKISLKMMESQKMVKDRQKKIDDARKALALLRNVSIIWPNSASEVLLAGSFDGWSSQRKMVKSVSGIFSLNLKLYPGHYEIKFIVDGVWMIDPLRPIVNDRGYENNLLLVS